MYISTSKVYKGSFSRQALVYHCTPLLSRLFYYTTTMSHILSTPFGTFKGKNGDGITQYRGIKYATVRDQLSAPELVTDYGTDIVDAMHYGYVIPYI
jgi:hypothetical protein